VCNVWKRRGSCIKFEIEVADVILWFGRGDVFRPSGGRPSRACTITSQSTGTGTGTGTCTLTRY
jgi:hypothetical protein